MEKIVVVISGPPGAGSSTISKAVARKLKLKYFSPGLVHKKIGKSKTESEAALKAWEKESSKKFHNTLDEKQISLAKKGNIVICGKLSIHFLKNLSKYKIWLDVPLEVRAKRAVDRDKIDFHTALNEISQRENIERREFKKIYGFDYFDQKKSADFVLDSSDLTVGQTVQKILNFIKSS